MTTTWFLSRDGWDGSPVVTTFDTVPESASEKDSFRLLLDTLELGMRAASELDSL